MFRVILKFHDCWPGSCSGKNGITTIIECNPIRNINVSNKKCALLHFCSILTRGCLHGCWQAPSTIFFCNHKNIIQMTRLQAVDLGWVSPRWQRNLLTSLYRSVCLIWWNGEDVSVNLSQCFLPLDNDGRRTCLDDLKFSWARDHWKINEYLLKSCLNRKGSTGYWL